MSKANTAIYCLKLGGSVITDKTQPYKANTEVIRAIAKKVKSLNVPLVIAHGSGSFGHTSAQKYGGKRGYTDKWGIAKVSRDAQEINRIVMDILVEEGLPAIAFSPRSFLLTEGGTIDETFFKPIQEALQQGLIPVIYGDVIWDRSQKTTILSGETILNALCKYLQRQSLSIARVVQLCNVDGVLGENNAIVSEITQDNWESVQKHLHAVTVADVTGGMKHKVEDALMLANSGIQTVLIHGNAQELLPAIKGKKVKGTLIHLL